jgi:integrase
MTSLRLKYVHRFRDRHGHVRHYFRRAGQPRTSLPGLPGSAEFMAAYQSCLGNDQKSHGASRTVSGSFAALVVSWLDDSEFKALSPSSQVTYRRIIDAFLANHGEKPVALLESRHVREILKGKSDTPAAANRLRSILRLLMRHAVEHGWRADDPMLHVRKVPYQKGEFRTWKEDDIARYEARWPLGSRERLALALLLYTGQRRGDVIRMGRQHIKGSAIDVLQEKTKGRLTIPLHPALKVAIDALPPEHLTFLVTQYGKPFASGNAFYNWFMDRARAADIEAGLSPHGLRKAAARRLAEAGCTTHQIASITGHKTLSEVQRYTKAADQERLAIEAMANVVRIGSKPDGA